MDLVRIKIWLNPHNMMAEAILNQDSILDFPKCPHILNICHLKVALLDFGDHFYFQNGPVMKLFAADWLLMS